LLRELTLAAVFDELFLLQKNKCLIRITIVSLLTSSCRGLADGKSGFEVAARRQDERQGRGVNDRPVRNLPLTLTSASLARP